MSRRSGLCKGTARTVLSAGWFAGAMLCAAGAQAASPDDSGPSLFGPFLGALGETKPIVDVRLRSESVDQEPLAEDASSITLRARIGFETGRAWQTALLAEGEFVTPLENDYRGDNSVARKTQYPVVADPEAYEVNRLQLTNTALPGTTIVLGRQRINMDDQRFVGNVGWRQNEQTYDALRITNRSVANLTIDTAYLNQVNRVFGPDSPQGRYRGDSYLANVAYQFGFGKLTGFGYLLDFEPISFVPAAPALNPARVATETYGVRFTGERPLAKFKITYAASYAAQEDYADNPLTFTNDYYAGELGAVYRQYSAAVGTEVLQGNGVAGFATPLATLHRFDGWADKFLTTPANGLNRRYVTVGYLMKGMGPLETLGATAVYHDFTSERASIDYGTELDLQLQAKWQRFTALLKYADYNADATTPATHRDTVKYWLQLDFVW